MNVTSKDGSVVSWGGEVAGPILVHGASGGLLAVSLYEAEIGVEGQAELRKVSFFVSENTRQAIKVRAGANFEGAIRQCVGRYLENRIRNKWIPENKEFFSVDQYELISIYNDLASTAALV